MQYIPLILSILLRIRHKEKDNKYGGHFWPTFRLNHHNKHDTRCSKNNLLGFWLYCIVLQKSTEKCWNYTFWFHIPTDDDKTKTKYTPVPIYYCCSALENWEIETACWEFSCLIHTMEPNNDQSHRDFVCFWWHTGVVLATNSSTARKGEERHNY